MASHIIRVLDTTLALSAQFTTALSLKSSESPSTKTTETEDTTTPSPLALLSASSDLLKSQVSKTSLLAINAPFTPSAIITTVSAINDSVLPSLVTAALLIDGDGERYTAVFAAETRARVKSALGELDVLIGEIRAVALRGGVDGGEDQKRKDVIVTATGRVWGTCDRLLTLAGDGVVGLVVERAGEYLELVRDAIRELREWDPAEDDDDDDGFWGDDGGEAGKADTVDDEDEDEDEEDEEECKRLQDEKQHMLRILSPVAQAYPAIISHRLKHVGEPSTASTLGAELDSLLSCLRDIPDLTDEAAGSLYEANIPSAAEYTEKTLDRAIAAVTVTRDMTGVENGDDDRFSKWATVWLNVVKDVRRSRLTNGVDAP